MPDTYIFFSGSYRTWNGSREIGVPYRIPSRSGRCDHGFFGRLFHSCMTYKPGYCGRILVKGLKEALRGPFREIVVRINGKNVLGWTHKNDHLLLPEHLGPGTHWLQLEIIYNDLENRKSW